MLVLNRRMGQSIILCARGVMIKVVFLGKGQGAGRFNLGVDAPPEVAVWREEAKKIVMPSALTDEDFVTLSLKRRSPEETTTMLHEALLKLLRQRQLADALAEQVAECSLTEPAAAALEAYRKSRKEPTDAGE